jgi:hypothetical protein
MRWLRYLLGVLLGFLTVTLANRMVVAAAEEQVAITLYALLGMVVFGVLTGLAWPKRERVDE